MLRSLNTHHVRTVGTRLWLQSATLALFKYAIVLCIGLLALGLPSVVAAEGSVNLTSSGGDRPFLEYIITQSANPPTSVDTEFAIAGVQRQTIIYAYAEAGERLHLGMTPMSGFFTGTDARIVAVPPDGSAPITFLPGNTAGPGGVLCGRISTRANETDGPLGLTTSGPNSFQACEIDVTLATAGVWEIHFVAPGATAAVQDLPTTTLASDPLPLQDTDNTYINAWDVTVSQAGVPRTPVTGRVYTRALAVTTGSNGANGVNSNLFVKAYDGAEYQVNLNGLDGFTSIFKSDTRGTIETTNNTSLYRSVQLVDEPSTTFLRVFGEPPAGFGTINPFTDDDIPNNIITHKLFFNTPDPNLPASAPIAKIASGGPVTNLADLANPGTPSTEWLNNPYVAPQAPQNLTFVGVEGTIGQAGTGLGGFIRFDNPNAPNEATSYRIELDFGVGFTPRYLFGTLTPGTNSVFWDGRDGAGAVVDVPAAEFTVNVTLNNGEIHFPVIDAELQTAGFEIIRQTPAIPTPLDTIYWDDRNFFDGTAPYNFSLCANGETPLPSFPGGAGTFGAELKCYGTSTGPREGLAGVPSTGGAHQWTANNVGTPDGQNDGFGNKRIINTWTYIPSPPVTLTGVIDIFQADLGVTKNLQGGFVPNGANAYQIVVTNGGTIPLNGVRLLDQIPASLTNVTWTCAPGAGGTCTPAGGAGNTIDVLLTMNPGETFTFNVNADAGATEPCNTATVTRPPDVNDPNTGNNSSSTGNPTSNIGLAMRVVESAPRTTANTYRVTMEYVVEAGSEALTDIQVTHDLEAWFNTQIPNASSISIISLTSSDFTTNGFYDGIGTGGDINLLTTTGNTLAAGETGVIRLTFEVVFPSTPGAVDYSSNANASGTRPDSSTATDTSTDGAIPDPNGDCDPTNNSDQTPINFPADATSITLLSFNGSSNGAPLWQTGWLGVAASVAAILLLHALAMLLWLRRRSTS